MYHLFLLTIIEFFCIFCIYKLKFCTKLFEMKLQIDLVSNIELQIIFFIIEIIYFYIIFFTGLYILKLKYEFGNCFWCIGVKCRKIIIINFIVIGIKLHRLHMKFTI